jgi:cell division protein FtsB
MVYKMVTAMPDEPGSERPPRGRTTRETRRGRGRRALQVLIAFIACVFIVDGIFGERGLLEKLRARRQYQALTMEIGRLRQENGLLREQARRLREDPRTIEEVARRELGLIREGELVFLIKDVPSPTAAPR